MIRWSTSSLEISTSTKISTMNSSIFIFNHLPRAHSYFAIALGTDSLINIKVDYSMRDFMPARANPDCLFFLIFHHPIVPESTRLCQGKTLLCAIMSGMIEHMDNLLEDIGIFYNIYTLMDFLAIGNAQLFTQPGIDRVFCNTSKFLSKKG